MGVEPLVLLANADKWLTESLESVLTQGGYRVITTSKRPQVLELARRDLPDGILLDLGLDQRTSDNLALCRALRADPTVSRATPRGSCAAIRSTWKSWCCGWASTCRANSKSIASAARG